MIFSFDRESNLHNISASSTVSVSTMSNFSVDLKFRILILSLAGFTASVNILWISLELFSLCVYKYCVLDSTACFIQDFDLGGGRRC